MNNNNENRLTNWQIGLLVVIALTAGYYFGNFWKSVPSQDEIVADSNTQSTNATDATSSSDQSYSVETFGRGKFGEEFRYTIKTSWKSDGDLRSKDKTEGNATIREHKEGGKVVFTLSAFDQSAEDYLGANNITDAKQTNIGVAEGFSFSTDTDSYLVTVPNADRSYLLSFPKDLSSSDLDQVLGSVKLN